MLSFCSKQKTAYELRISDWSSDGCSSDLGKVSSARASALSSTNSLTARCAASAACCNVRLAADVSRRTSFSVRDTAAPMVTPLPPDTDRESGVVGISGSVRVNSGGRRCSKKKRNQYVSHLLITLST